LAIQVSQAFPRWLKWAIAFAALTQSFLMAAGHYNTLRRNIQWLLREHFELPWMHRFWEIGADVTWVWPTATFTLLALALGLIWLPVSRLGAEERVHHAREAF
jgi:hypothetical protein